ncbi:MAG: Cytochrome c oxidase assembly protein cox15 [Trizodia sp. TS-e1964]|nr:MAG: Cytochrome c oxidase assembly protein cox15 [Trizodia sp. TS-e1964]
MPPALSLARALRFGQPKVASKFTECRHCLRAPAPASRLHRLPPPRFSSSLTFQPRLSPSSSTSASPLVALSKILGPPQSSSKASFFPRTTSNSVAYFLLLSATSVFGIVVFGGLTRLTESGLSITEWRPLTGTLPPLSANDWSSEFEKYRASPEAQILNPHISLEDFKKIYYMEWGHRLWGRVVGMTFVLPALYFVARRRVSGPMALRLGAIGSLIGVQGVLGWWMVKSGLKDDLFAPGSHPRVSQYRLAAHLGTAIICYSAMVWNGLSILRENRILAMSPNAANNYIRTLSTPRLRAFRLAVVCLGGLVFTTALSGAFVAGLDAGLIYNDFPFMGGDWNLAPPKAELFSSFYSRRADGSDTIWRCMLENPALVQLEHRILAGTSASAVLALWVYSRYLPVGKVVRMTVNAAGGVVLMQASLGIATLLYLVPTPLAAAHQAGSLVLLSTILLLASRSLAPARLARLVKLRLSKG